MMGRYIFLFCVCAFVFGYGEASAERFRAVLEAQYQTPVHAEVTSTVEEIVKDMGESFNKSDVLMKLEDKVYQAKYEKAKAILERAKAGLGAQEKLYNDGVASLVELREAQANFGMANADWIIAQKELEACTIDAPYDGHVQDVHVQWLERVEPGQPLMELLDDSVLIAKLLIPARFQENLKVGTVLSLTIAGRDKTRSATVIRIAPAIDPSSSLVQVHAELKNQDRKLRAGMIGMVEITGAK